ELSTTSQMRWWRPRGPVEPMYMPGRSRTASRPSRTVMSFAAYVSRVAVTTLLQGFGDLAGAGRPACGRRDLHSCKSTGTAAVSQALCRPAPGFLRSALAFPHGGRAGAAPLL